MSHTVNNTGIQLPHGNIQLPHGNALINLDSESDSDSEETLLLPLLDRVPQPPVQIGKNTHKAVAATAPLNQSS